MSMNPELKNQVNWLIEQIESDMKSNPEKAIRNEVMERLVILSEENASVEAYLLPMEYDWIDYVLMSY